MRDNQNNAPLPSVGADVRLSAEEMLCIPGFKASISARYENNHQPHDSEAADKDMDERIIAIYKCLMN